MLPPFLIEEAREHGLELGARGGMTYVHGFDDPHGACMETLQPRPSS